MGAFSYEKVCVFDTQDQVASAAADLIASEARSRIAETGRFVLAVSGGTTPWKMLRCLALLNVPWSGIHIVQVDERVAPDGHGDRNLTHLLESLLANAPISRTQIHAMQVEEADLDRAAENYAALLADITYGTSIIDLVHLGLGADGHTASLVPGDPTLEVTDTDVAPTGLYQGRRRLTLTYPILNRASKILWLLTGAEKAPMLQRLIEGDPSIPAGRVSDERAIILADRAAFGYASEASPFHRIEE